MNKFFEKFLIALGAIVIVFLVCLLFAWPFMLLWNWLMPTIFGLTTITFWQGFGILILCSFLFKSPSSNSK